MALLHTPQIQDHFAAPDFTLKSTAGDMVTFEDIRGENGTVVAFICNHCPYVLAIIERFVQCAVRLQDQKIGVVAIMSNDTDAYPEDNFENMQTFAKAHTFSFPYLLDESQDIAQAYNAVCTPDIFGFNADNQLHYRGRLDSAGPNAADIHTQPELLHAMIEIAKSGKGPDQQTPSMGCSLKWK